MPQNFFIASGFLLGLFSLCFCFHSAFAARAAAGGKKTGFLGSIISTESKNIQNQKRI